VIYLKIGGLNNRNRIGPFQFVSSASPSFVTQWVAIAASFRVNLIVDLYDLVFADMLAGNLKHLRRANSEDAITWNVFSIAAANHARSVLAGTVATRLFPSAQEQLFPGNDSRDRCEPDGYEDPA
jgi:hypothetical protein